MAEGRDALVAQRLGRLVSVDMVTEAGAGPLTLPAVHRLACSIIAQLSLYL